MPDLDLDNGADPQDEAETFDETNREDELGAADGDFEDNADIAADVYDVTSAIGDADDDDGRNNELDAADGVEGVSSDDLENDEDEDDRLDDGFDDDPGGDYVEDDDDAVGAAAALPRSSEPGLTYVADVDASTTPRDDEVEKYESTRPLSDAQLSALGYLSAESDAGNQEKTAMDSKTPDDTKARPEIWEERTFAEELHGEVIQGSGATADDVADESDPDEEDRLDEGLEETFPASDPVSAKHIT